MSDTKDTPDRIIFLDADGPIISTGCYGVTPYASSLRACMNQNAIGYLNMLVNHTKARIVTNSSHNYHEVKNNDGGFRDLKTDLIRFGVKEEYFHKIAHKFPTYGKFSGGNMNRLIAIEEWITRNETSQWVCFDDEIFTKDQRLIPIDFDRWNYYEIVYAVLVKYLK